MKRRAFVKSVLAGAVSSLSVLHCQENSRLSDIYSRLDDELAGPVLKHQLFDVPAVIREIDLLHYRDNYICRAISEEGAIGYSVSNNAHMRYLYPIVVKKIIPFFIGKDARNLDRLIDDVYIHDSNYKLQGLAFWISLATVEFAILDLLGQIADKPIGELIGEIHNPEIAVYRANNYRGLSAEESIQRMKRNVDQSAAKAVKFKIGGRMRKDQDDPPGRTEKLIPLVRKTFGEEMILYADSNGSYSEKKAIEIGRLLEKHSVSFFEEPVPFDWYEETRNVADALAIPIAGGEQESSMRNFRGLIANDTLQVIQPDMFYFGGMVRSMRVARMARSLGKECTPHISGSGLGYVYMMHFVSTLPNAGPFHEFKGINPDIPFDCPSSSLKSENGAVTVPTGPGLGLTLDPGFVKRHTKVTG